MRGSGIIASLPKRHSNLPLEAPLITPIVERSGQGTPRSLATRAWKRVIAEIRGGLDLTSSALHHGRIRGVGTGLAQGGALVPQIENAGR